MYAVVMGWDTTLLTPGQNYKSQWNPNRFSWGSPHSCIELANYCSQKPDPPDHLPSQHIVRTVASQVPQEQLLYFIRFHYFNTVQKSPGSNKSFSNLFHVHDGYRLLQSDFSRLHHGLMLHLRRKPIKFFKVLVSSVELFDRDVFIERFGLI